MVVQANETLSLSSQEDVVRARQFVRDYAVKLGFNLIDQTKLVTATSELARNAVVHGGGGVMQVETVSNGSRRGLHLVFEDKGPGIPDIELALKDGYTSGGGLGLGLGGARRLVSEFDLSSCPGKGTRVSIIKWR